MYIYIYINMIAGGPFCRPSEDKTKFFLRFPYLVLLLLLRWANESSHMLFVTKVI